MTDLDLLARAARQFDRGIITASEFATKLSDCFAGYPDLRVTDAIHVAALIPPPTRDLVLRQIDLALTPGYLRRAFRVGGRSRTEEEEHADALKETAREQAWAAALQPLLSRLADEEIRHEELPGEIERLQAFEKRKAAADES